MGPATTPITFNGPAQPTAALRFGKKSKVDEFLAQHNLTETPKKDRIKGALKGAVAEVFKPMKILIDIGIGTLLAIATFWLPGSQLLTIPAYLAISAAFRAVHGAMEGYKHPYSNKQSEQGMLGVIPVTT